MNNDIEKFVINSIGDESLKIIARHVVDHITEDELTKFENFENDNVTANDVVSILKGDQPSPESDTASDYVLQKVRSLIKYAIMTFDELDELAHQIRVSGSIGVEEVIEENNKILDLISQLINVAPKKRKPFVGNVVEYPSVTEDFQEDFFKNSCVLEKRECKRLFDIIRIYKSLKMYSDYKNMEEIRMKDVVFRSDFYAMLAGFGVDTGEDSAVIDLVNKEFESCFSDRKYPKEVNKALVDAVLLIIKKECEAYDSNAFRIVKKQVEECIRFINKRLLLFESRCNTDDIFCFLSDKHELETRPEVCEDILAISNCEFSSVNHIYNLKNYGYDVEYDDKKLTRPYLTEKEVVVVSPKGRKLLVASFWSTEDAVRDILNKIKYVKEKYDEF